MNASASLSTLGDNEVLQQLDRKPRRVHNRGLADYVLVKAQEFQGGPFRPEDLRKLVKDSYPAASQEAIGNALSLLARDKKGIERVGAGRTGLYRVVGGTAMADDEAVIENALRALADLEALVHRYRDVLPALQAFKKAVLK